MECRKTITEVISLTNHKGYRQCSEPIKIQSEYMQPTRSAGTRVEAGDDDLSSD